MRGHKNEGFRIGALQNQAKTKKRTCISASSYGADGRIRTGDLILTKDALYRLSYISTSSSLDARLIILHLTSKSKGIFKVYCNFTMEAERSDRKGRWGYEDGAGAPRRKKERDRHENGSGGRKSKGRPEVCGGGGEACHEAALRLCTRSQTDETAIHHARMNNPGPCVREGCAAELQFLSIPPVCGIIYPGKG